MAPTQLLLSRGTSRPRSPGCLNCLVNSWRRVQAAVGIISKRVSALSSDGCRANCMLLWLCHSEERQHHYTSIFGEVLSPPAFVVCEWIRFHIQDQFKNWFLSMLRKANSSSL